MPGIGSYWQRSTTVKAKTSWPGALTIEPLPGCSRTQSQPRHGTTSFACSATRQRRSLGCPLRQELARRCLRLAPGQDRFAGIDEQPAGRADEIDSPDHPEERDLVFSAFLEVVDQDDWAQECADAAGNVDGTGSQSHLR